MKALVEGLIVEPKKTMIGIKLRGGRRRGICWLPDPQRRSYYVYLRELDYSPVDKDNRIKYPKPGATSWRYPKFKLRVKEDVDYAFSLIEYAMEQAKKDV